MMLSTSTSYRGFHCCILQRVQVQLSPSRTMSSSVIQGRQEVNGVNIYYEKAGHGNHPVLLIPGAAGSCKTDLQPQIQKLNREKFTVVGIDLRGYGKSRPPERDYPLDFFHRDAKDAKDLMLALGFQKFSVLGWSDGAIVGIFLAAKYSECLRKLAIWGGNTYITKKDLELFEATRNIKDWSKRMRDPMIEVYGAEAFQRLWNNWIDGILNIYRKNDADICKKEVADIGAPTLILHGDKDPMVPEEHPLYMLRHIKGSRLHRFPDGKHNIHLRYADEFNSLVEEFLEDS